MTSEAINELKKYTFRKKNTEKVEISVLKLERIIKALEQEPVIDKIRAEIERQEKWLLQAGCTAYNVDIAFDAIKSAVGRGDVE